MNKIVYRYNPGLVFPELPVPPHAKQTSQSTTDSSSPVAAMTLTLAYLLAGGVIPGVPLETVASEMEEFCASRGIPLERLSRWAESILLPTDATLSSDELKSVPTMLPSVLVDGKPLCLDPYQITKAAWGAKRLGVVQALDCGAGKSSISTASAIAAARLGRCSSKRCYIVCPLNAVPQWQDYMTELRLVYDEVQLVTCDSLHHILALDKSVGGALIIDEAHKLKSYSSGRTNEAHEVRSAFEWAVSLTGTLLHTGPEGVLSVQDLACPGLSRYLDVWAFGEAFNAIAQESFKKCNKWEKRNRLVLVPESSGQSFGKYLARSCTSISFETPEFKASVVIPENTRILISDWTDSDWVRAKESVQPAYVEAEAMFNRLTENDDAVLSYADVLDKKVAYLNPIVADWRMLFPAIATADMVEAQQTHAKWLSTLSEDEKQFVEPDKLLMPGLPHFAAVLHTISKLGWEDKLLQYVPDINQHEGNTLPPFPGYSWVRPEGHSVENPAPGVKIRWVMDWLKNNRDEPLVVGAAAVDTLNLVQAQLIAANIPFRLIRGGVGKVRKQYVADFQAGKFRVMLLQQVAGSESVTLTKARTSVLLDHDWSPIAYSQFTHRTHRRGQKRETTHYDMVYGEIQHQIVARLKRGEAFDGKTRKRIEAEVQNVLR